MGSFRKSDSSEHVTGPGVHQGRSAVNIGLKFADASDPSQRLLSHESSSFVSRHAGDTKGAFVRRR